MDLLIDAYKRPPGDPSWSQTIALLKFNGSNENLAPSGIAFPASGGLSYDGAPKFGSASLKVNGTAPGGGGVASLKSDTEVRLTLGDFTAEAWCLMNSVPTVYGPILNTYSNFNGTEISLRVSNAGTPEALINTALGGSSTISTATTITLGEWFHIALSRVSGVYRLFFNGVSQGTSTSVYTVPSGFDYRLCVGGIGYPTSSLALDGLIDEVRVKAGIGIYTSNFTPSPQEFPHYPE